jgi:hypothetical protein
MRGADYLVMRVDNGRVVWRRRSGNTWQTGRPEWKFKPQNADVPMALMVARRSVRLSRQQAYRGVVPKPPLDPDLQAVEIARGTLAELWETFMDYARML